MNGTLTIVGLGPARAEQATVEALRLLQAAVSAPRTRCYGLGHARTMALELVPELTVASLDWIYEVPGVSRPAAYADLAAMMRRRVEDGWDVVYLVPGSPLFYNDAVYLLRTQDLPLRMVHGMSFVEWVLDGVKWTGHTGLQLWSAWNVAVDGIGLHPEAPALLCQLGEAPPSLGGARSEQSMLERLRDALLAQGYAADHEVVVLSSSGPPRYDNGSTPVALADLADADAPIYANLWVPPREVS
jgi:uncharacterized protein YabN with tetrapyrrole methylase and pyrophosphatase domain